MFYTYKDEIYVGEIDFKMNPINKYKHFHTMTRHINTIAIGSEHCLILDGDYFLNFISLIFIFTTKIYFQKYF